MYRSCQPCENKGCKGKKFFAREDPNCVIKLAYKVVWDEELYGYRIPMKLTKESLQTLIGSEIIMPDFSKKTIDSENIDELNLLIRTHEPKGLENHLQRVYRNREENYQRNRKKAEA